MAQVKDNPEMTVVADIPGLLEEMQQCNAQLDIVEKGVFGLCACACVFMIVRACMRACVHACDDIVE